MNFRHFPPYSPPSSPSLSHWHSPPEGSPPFRLPCLPVHDPLHLVNYLPECGWEGTQWGKGSLPVSTPQATVTLLLQWVFIVPHPLRRSGAQEMLSSCVQQHVVSRRHLSAVDSFCPPPAMVPQPRMGCYSCPNWANTSPSAFCLVMCFCVYLCLLLSEASLG